MKDICERVQHHLWSSDPRPAYRGIRALRSRKPDPQRSAVKSASGELLSEGPEVLNRWAGYFEQLHKADPPARELVSRDVTPVVADPPISCDPPDLEEIRAAVRQLRGGRAAGICGIQAELLKAGGEAALLALHSVFSVVWRTGIIPADWKRGLIVPLWKGKGDRQDCSNYRGVTLLSVPGKVFARVILNRVRGCLLKYQRPEQSGFTPKKSTVDRILALRVLIERKREFRQKLFAAYVDLRKAFDSVHREALWRVLQLRGVPTKLVDLIAALYSGTESAVRCGGAISDFFPVDSGVRQGCVLAPTLFSACMDWVMHRVVDRSGCGAPLGEATITDLDFADDVVIFAELVDGLVRALEVLSEEAEPLGLRVSWLKTKLQSFDDSTEEAIEPVCIAGENVGFAERFSYLGSDVVSSGGSEPEVNKRLGRAMGVMASLDKGVWRCRYLCKRSKVQVFRTLVLPVLLYGCEAWTLTRSLRQRLNSFGTMSLRRILGYRWLDRVSNQRLLREAGMRYVTCIIRERQLRLFGHIARLPEADPARQVLYTREPTSWRRPRGRPRANWLQQMDRHCRGLGMGRVSAWGMACRRPQEYRRKVNAATRCFSACSHT